MYFSPLHFFASLAPLHFESLLVDGGPAVRLADKGGVQVIWRARRDFFHLSLSPIVCEIFIHHTVCLISVGIMDKSETITGLLLCSSRSRPSEIVVGAGLPTAAASTKWSIICFPADPVLSKQLSWGARVQYQALPLQVILLHHVLSNHLSRSVQATLRVC